MKKILLSAIAFVLLFLPPSHASRAITSAYGAGGGGYLVAYVEFVTDPFFLYSTYVRFVMVDPAGNPTTTPTLLSPDQGYFPGAAYGSTADVFLVTWRQTDYALKGRIVASDGTPLGDVIDIAASNAAAGLGFSPVSGKFLVAYRSAGTTDVVGRLIGTDGALWGDEFPILGVSGSDTDVDIAYDPDNDRFLVVAGGGASPSSVVARLVGSDGSAISDPVVVGASAVHYTPSAAFDPLNGRFLIAYEVYTGSGHYIGGGFLNGDGSLGATGLTLNGSTTANNAMDLAHRADNGDYVLAWSDERIGYSIYAKELDGTAGELVAETPVIPSAAQAATLCYNPAAGNVLLGTRTAAGGLALEIIDDSDGDGLFDSHEETLGTDPLSADTDKDGLIDEEEVNHFGTDPLDADTDDDGLMDGSESAMGLDRLDEDSDGDGLTDGQEIGRSAGVADGTSTPGGIAFSGTAPGWMPDSHDASKTDPLDPDSDNDGLCDGPVSVPGVCVGGEDRDADGNRDPLEPDPVDADSDDDGLRDGGEDVNGNGSMDLPGETNPIMLDTDSDGLNDGQERGATSLISGGTSMGAYIANRVNYAGTAPSWTADANPATTTDPLDSDTDNDGLSDGTEDQDLDGAVDITETDPNDADTDDDTVLDGNDPQPLVPTVCGDADADTCDDCSQGNGADIADDGPDFDSDGSCDAGDADDDNDGVPDTSDPAPQDALACGDADADTCDDCSQGNGADIADDGPDFDSDGSCDAGDPDIDGDDSLNASDCDEFDPAIYPGAAEVCGDGVDQDCSGTADDDPACAPPSGGGGGGGCFLQALDR